jgi:hypothetical protein
MTVSSTEPRRAVSALPLQGSYARQHAVFPSLRIHSGPLRTGAGWVGTAELVRGEAALREMVAHDAALGLADYGEPLRPDVAAGFSLHRYTWPVSLAFTLPWFLERRVPRLPVDRMAVNRSAGEVAVRPAEFACLPDDPAAGTAGTRVVPDAPALRAELRAALTEHLTPVLAAFRPLVRRGPRTLWGIATDDVIEGLWYLGGLLGEEDRAAAEVSELLPGPGDAPFVGGADFRPAESAGATRTRTRASCCLFYTVRPEETCATCPRVCSE